MTRGHSENPDKGAGVTETEMPSIYTQASSLRSAFPPSALLMPTVLQPGSHHLQLMMAEATSQTQTPGRGSKGPGLREGLGFGGGHTSDFPVPRGNGNPLLPARSHSGLQQYYHSPALLLIMYFASRKRGLNYISQLPNIGHRPTEQGWREIR